MTGADRRGRYSAGAWNLYPQLPDDAGRVFSARMVRGPGRPAGFEKEIKQAGWTLFFMAGEIKASVFGFDRQRTAQTALRRLGAIVKSQSCNCIEITDVTEKSFLKLPYIRVRAHARHLQPSLVFSATQSNGRRSS